MLKSDRLAYEDQPLDRFRGSASCNRIVTTRARFSAKHQMCKDSDQAEMIPSKEFSNGES